MRIVITMTATYRPKIIDKTLQSFTSMLFDADKSIDNLDVVLVCNVDPIGDDNVRLDDVINIIHKYFDNKHLLLFSGEDSHFGKAFHRVWTYALLGTGADFVFHLEDDWILLEPVRLSKLLSIMYQFPKLALLRLSSSTSKATVLTQWGHDFYWNGHFFQIPVTDQAKLRVAGHPAIIRPSFIKRLLPFIDPEKNPEKQISESGTQTAKILAEYEFGVYNEPSNGPIIRDIGREWMTQNNLQKKGNKAWFVEWEKQSKEEN